jgi:hypothetical protein
MTMKKGETIQVVNEANEIGEKKVTVYEINGELRLPKSGETAKDNENTGSPSAVGNRTR